jgi:hypothetical protein
MANATYSRNPIVQAAVDASVSIASLTTQTLLYTCPANSYAILRVSWNGSGGTLTSIKIGVGSSSSSVRNISSSNFDGSGVLVGTNTVGVFAPGDTSATLSGSDYCLTEYIYVGPGMKVYALINGASVSGAEFYATGVEFKNG